MCGGVQGDEVDYSDRSICTQYVWIKELGCQVHYYMREVSINYFLCLGTSEVQNDGTDSEVELSICSQLNEQVHR